jgi:hypothetical protein
MSFLAPLFLMGAAAVVFPVLFHLIRRSSRERISFSSLMFLMPSLPRITKRSRLENFLLLLLRCLLVALLAFAFARPFLPKATAPVTGSNAPARVIVLLDASASMRREGLFESGREQVFSLLGRLNPADVPAVYLFDRQLQSVLSLDESSRLLPEQRIAEVHSRLAQVTPGWKSTSIGNALTSAAEILLDAMNRDSKQQGESRGRIVLISDLQSGARLDGLQGFEWPRGIQVDIVPLRASEPSNASVEILQDPNKANFARGTSQVLVRAQNAAGSRLEQFNIQWQAGAGNADPTQKGKLQPIYVPGGQGKIFTTDMDVKGANRLVLSGDQVSFDNVVWHLPAASNDVRVFYLGNEEAGNPQQGLYYIKRAYEQTNLAIQVISGTNLVNRGTLPSLLVAGKTMNSDELTFARELVIQGKTLLMPLYSASDQSRIEQVLGSPGVRVSEASVSTYALIGKIDFTHSFFAPFADARFSDFTKIHFWKYRKLDLGSSTNAHVLLGFDSGDPCLVEVPLGKGRVYLFASSWLPGDSQFALSSKFVPILFAALEESHGESSGAKQYRVGESVRIPAAIGPSDEAANSRDVIMPDGTKRTFQGEIFNETSMPGLYRAGGFEFAVNLDPAESKTAPLPLDALSSLGVPINQKERQISSFQFERQRHLIATELEQRQKYWRWFMLAAVGIILVETWASGRLSRPTTVSA